MTEDALLAPLVSAEDLEDWAEQQRARGRSIVLTNGVYDLLHPGHVRSVLAASAYGDVLLVAVNSDRSVRALKGPGRPILTQEDRSFLLRGLRGVHAVTIFDDRSILPTILCVRPDVVAKGGQYSETEIVGSEEVASWGGRVVRLPMVEGVSTTELLARIRRAAADTSGGKEER